MMDFERFQPFWSTTKWLAAFLVCMWYFVALGALIFADLFNELVLFGFPVGLLVVGILVALIGVALIFWFVGSQDQIDQNFGANEDL